MLILSLIRFSITGNVRSFKWNDLVIFPCWSKSTIRILAPYWLALVDNKNKREVFPTPPLTI